MIKFLFLDYRQMERVDGFARHLEKLADHGPVMLADGGWEQWTLGLYGTVLRRDDGLFQMWYTGGRWGREGRRRLGYAESGDGIEWRRPALDVASHEGQPGNIVLDASHVGCAVILDTADPRPDWRYKLVIAPEPHERMSLYRSPDGQHWLPGAENPVVGVHPDGPIGFRRDDDGRYVLYHRPRWGDRRVARTESWDLQEFTRPRVVLEPEPGDGANVQFYGMGAMAYGPYEIGTLWVYRTDPGDLVWTKPLGVLDVELVHGRGGHAWHRTALGESWLPRPDDPAAFGHGQIHMASSPVPLGEEIRFYYAGTPCRHGEDRGPEGRPGWAIGHASCLPDRFVGIRAARQGELLTRPFWSDAPRVFVNADVEAGGEIRGEAVDVAGTPIAPFTFTACEPVTGSGWRQPLRWDGGDPARLAGREIRLRIRAERATLYALAIGTAAEVADYRRFDLPYHLPMEWQRRGR